MLQPPSSITPGAGRLHLFIDFWRKVTTNNFVLQIVEFGYKIQFFKIPPMLTLNSGTFSTSRSLSVSNEVSILQLKTAVITIPLSEDQFVSPIFTVPKKDSDKRRVILNLKFLNTFILKTTFKLEGYEVISNMIQPGDFFVSIDLCDAYLMFLMHPDYWKYLCFDWKVRFCFRCMPFGLTSSPRIFTKVFKRVLIFLRSRGLRISAWFDDIILVANSISLLLEQFHFTLHILKSLGFIPNPEKSMLTPSQKINHLGFDWDSKNFNISVPEEKVSSLKILCKKTRSKKVSLRFLNKILGTIENFRIGFPYAALHYRGIQHDVAYYISLGYDWDDQIELSDLAINNINWWLQCPIKLTPKSLNPFSPQYTLTTDSSKTGWGAVSSNGLEASGFWSEEECPRHINSLETEAVILALRSLFRKIYNVSILIKSDNTSTVAYINNMGGRSSEISNIIIDLYEFCIQNEIRIQAMYLCGRKNVRADALSRRPRDHCYSLPPIIFSDLCDRFSFIPVTDLFASRVNHKLPNYFSDGPDPFASGFDAFVMPWPESVYAFPPIHLVDKFITSFLNQKVKFGLIICPFWPSQPYFSTLLNLLIDDPFLFSASVLEETQMLPQSASTLMACYISSTSAPQMEYQKRLPRASSEALKHKHCVPTYGVGKSLHIGVIRGKLITAHYL